MTQVVELVESWNVVTTSNTQTGTRVYVDASVRPDATPTTLPSIGDAWDNGSHAKLYLQQISETYINDNDNCGKKYTLTYGAGQVIAAIDLGDESSLPVAIDMGVQVSTYDDKSEWDDGWHWESDNERASDVKIVKREPITLVTLQRYWEQETINGWIALSSALVGKINDAPFYSTPRGTVLYLGCTGQQGTSESGSKQWLLTLKFSLFAVDGNFIANNGWTKAYRPDTNAYDTPLFNSDPDNTIYEYADLSPLITQTS